jgi:hypothetical protein
MTEQWDKVLEEKKEWLMPPEVVKAESTPAAKTGTAAQWGDLKPSGSNDKKTKKKEEKEAISNNSV